MCLRFDPSSRSTTLRACAFETRGPSKLDCFLKPAIVYLFLHRDALGLMFTKAVLMWPQESKTRHTPVLLEPSPKILNFKSKTKTSNPKNNFSRLIFAKPCCGRRSTNHVPVNASPAMCTSMLRNSKQDPAAYSSYPNPEAQRSKPPISPVSC